MYCSAKMMSVHDDDIVIFLGKTNHRVSPTEHTSENLTVGPESSSSSRPAQVEPTIFYIAPRSTIDSDAQTCAWSVTPIPISFDALSEDPILLKGCVIWNRRAFMVRIMASAKDNRRRRVWSREEQKSERRAEALG